MELFTEEQGQIRRYLLGYSEPEEVEGLEERLLTDENFLQEFCIVKDELVDDYISGALSGDVATRFETHFVSTPRRALKVNLARTLAVRAGSPTREMPETLDEYPAVPRPVAVPPLPLTARLQQYWPVAAGLAVMLLAGFVAWKTLQDHSRQPSGADQQRLQLESELARLNDPNSQLPQDSTVAVTLKPVSVRAIGEDRRVVVKEGGQIVMLQLELAGAGYESYKVQLQTDESVELAIIQSVKPTVEGKGRIVRLRLPGNQLLARGYQIKLSGLTDSGSYEDAGLYPFQVLKS